MAESKSAHFIAAICLGGVAVFGWAPWSWWPVLLVAVGGLFWLVSRACHPLHAGAMGLLFGLIMHVGVYGCLYPTLIDHVGVDSVPAFFYSALVLLGLSLFTAVPCMVYVVCLKYSKRQDAFALVQGAVFASLLIVGEFLRVIVFSRMSLQSIGYALIDTWWAGFAPIFGSYGLGWIGVFCATSLAGALGVFKSAKTQVVRVSFMVLVVAITGLVLQQKHWTEVDKASMSIRLIQSHVAQSNTLNSAQVRKEASRLVEQLTESPADIAITSETAFPMYWHEMPSALVERLKNFSNLTDSHLIFGVATMNAQFKGGNSMMLIKPGVNTIEQYNKVYLFPFGEYSPWGLGWLAKKFPSPRSDLLAGLPDQKPFHVLKDGNLLKIGMILCNEILLADASRKWASDVDILINPTNTVWFSPDVVIPQVLQIARMRALEVGRPVLHVSNAGGSAAISSSGQVMRSLGSNQEGTLTWRVSGEKGRTPYAVVGDYPILLLCFVCMGWGLVRIEKHNLPLGLDLRVGQYP
jgi:apolipoprotein N-acyltransferase